MITKAYRVRFQNDTSFTNAIDPMKVGEQLALIICTRQINAKLSLGFKTFKLLYCQNLLLRLEWLPPIDNQSRQCDKPSCEIGYHVSFAVKAFTPNVKRSQPAAQPNKYRPLQNRKFQLMPDQKAGSKKRQGGEG